MWVSDNCDSLGDLLALPAIDLVRCRFPGMAPLHREELEALFGKTWRLVERGPGPNRRHNAAAPARQQLEGFPRNTGEPTTEMVPTFTLLSDGNFDEYLGRWAEEMWRNIGGIAE